MSFKCNVNLFYTATPFLSFLETYVKLCNVLLQNSIPLNNDNNLLQWVGLMMPSAQPLSLESAKQCKLVMKKSFYLL